MKIRDHLSILKTINVADYVSLSAIFPTVLAYYFIFIDKPNQAIIAVSFAFFLDTLDGYLARKLEISSEFGKYLDSFVDTLNYLVFSALFTISFLNFNTAITLICVSVMLSSGVLRLSRFNLTGFIGDKDQKYYVGIIVPFAQLSIVFLFLLSSFVSPGFVFFTPFVLLIISFLMISKIKFKKPQKYTLWFLLTLLIICLATINLNK